MMNEYRNITETPWADQPKGVDINVSGLDKHMLNITVDLTKWSIDATLIPRHKADLDTDQVYTKEQIIENTKAFADSIDVIINVHSTE